MMPASAIPVWKTLLPREVVNWKIASDWSMIRKFNWLVNKAFFLNCSLQKVLLYTFLNSLPVELVNWCYQRLVGALWKYQAQHGGSMATLGVGTSPASGHQPAPSHWRNFSGGTFLTWYSYCKPLSCEGWEGWALNWQNRQLKQWSRKLNWESKLQMNYDDQNSDMSKVVIHKDQWSRQLQVWRLELKCKYIWRQAPVATPQIIETAGCIGSRLT